MKKIFGIIGLAAMLVLPLVGCSNGDDSPSALQSEIDAGGMVDLQNKNVSENVSINKANTTLQNADFQGKTITVNATGVKLENISNATVRVVKASADDDFHIKDSKNIKLIVDKEGANSIYIKDSTIDELTTLKNSSTIKFDGNTTASKVDIKSESAKLEANTNTAKISVLTVEKEVSDIELVGVTVKNLKVIIKDNETGKRNFKFSNGTNIENITKEKENGNPANDVKITVIKNGDVTIPEDSVSVKEVKRVELHIGDKAKKKYEEGEKLEYTDLSINISYSDYSMDTNIPLTALNSTNTYSSGKIGKQSITFYYNGIECNDKLEIEVIASTKDYKKYLSNAIDFFIAEDWDKGLSEIEKAYKDTKNNETNLYYALANIVSIVKDEKTISFIKDNLGFDKYEGTLNSFLSFDWIKSNKYNPTEIFSQGNKEGFDEALKKALGAISPHYEEAKKASKDISNRAVLFPRKAITAFDLDKIFGDDDVYVGKTEINAAIGAVGLVKGMLEYLSVYDWKIYLVSLGDGEVSADDIIRTIHTGENLLTVKNSNYLETSKQTLSDSLDLLITSYEDITGPSKLYPDVIKNFIENYKIFYEGARELNKSIKNGTKFYVIINPFGTKLTKWPTQETEGVIVSIDFSKVFKPDAWEKLIEKDSSGKVQFYTKYKYSGYSNSYIEDESEVTPLTTKFSEAVESAKNEAKQKIPEGAKVTVTLYIKVDASNVVGDKGKGFIPITSKTEKN